MGWMSLHREAGTSDRGWFQSEVLGERYRIEELVPEPPNEYARQWQERCRAEIATKERARLVAHGTVVHFAEALHFSDGVAEDEFAFFERSSFRRVTDRRLVQITSWRSRTDWSFERRPELATC